MSQTTFSDAQFDFLLGQAEAEIARWEEELRLQVGYGLEMEGDELRVLPEVLRAPVAGEGGVRVIAPRYAQELPLEVRGGRIYVNLPPIYGAVPVLNGSRLYADPRPSFAVLANDCKILAQIDYTRLGVSYPSGEDTVSIGLTVADVHVTLVQAAVGFMPTPITPSGGEGQASPFPGAYREWLTIGTVVDGVAIPTVFMWPSSECWGGVSLRTVPSFGEEGWGFFSGVTYP